MSVVIIRSSFYHCQSRCAFRGTGEQEVWKIVFAYVRRWQIEMKWRESSSELAYESPRLWKWETRLKLLLMVSLVYSFLLTLLDGTCAKLKDWLLRYWCHQTGKWCREATTPLYRLRWALSRLWVAQLSTAESSPMLN